MRKEAANTWSEGLIMDLNPISMPNSALSDCVNGTYLTYDGNEMALQNDKGNYKLKGSELSKDFIPVGIASYGDVLYVVSYNPITEQSEIGSFPSPNNAISSELDESLNIKSIITSALDDEHGNKQVVWEKAWLEEKYKKDFVFYGVGTNDLTISPGDFYKIEDVPSKHKYESFDYSILSNSHKYSVKVSTEPQLNPVSWEVAGYLNCSFSLPSVDNLQIIPLTLDVPKKTKRGLRWTLIGEDKVSSSFSIAFESNSKIIEEANANGDLLLKVEVQGGDNAPIYLSTNALTANDYAVNTTYSAKFSVDGLPFSIDSLTGLNAYSDIKIKATLYVLYDDKEVEFLSGDTHVSLPTSEEEFSTKIADKYFQYTYDKESESLHIYTNLTLQGIPSSNFKVNAALKHYNDDCSSIITEPYPENLYSHFYPNTHTIDFTWPTPLKSDFYAIDFSIIDDDKLIDSSTHFIIASEKMLEHQEWKDCPNDLLIFDNVPADKLSSLITFTADDVLFSNAVGRKVLSQRTTTEDFFNGYLSKDSDLYKLVYTDDYTSPIITTEATIEKTGDLTANIITTTDLPITTKAVKKRITLTGTQQKTYNYQLTNTHIKGTPFIDEPALDTFHTLSLGMPNRAFYKSIGIDEKEHWDVHIYALGYDDAYTVSKTGDAGKTLLKSLDSYAFGVRTKLYASDYVTTTASHILTSVPIGKEDLPFSFLTNDPLETKEKLYFGETHVTDHLPDNNAHTVIFRDFKESQYTKGDYYLVAKSVDKGRVFFPIWPYTHSEKVIMERKFNEGQTLTYTALTDYKPTTAHLERFRVYKTLPDAEPITYYYPESTTYTSQISEVQYTDTEVVTAYYKNTPFITEGIINTSLLRKLIDPQGVNPIINLEKGAEKKEVVLTYMNEEDTIFNDVVETIEVNRERINKLAHTLLLEEASMNSEGVLKLIFNANELPSSAYYDKYFSGEEAELKFSANGLTQTGLEILRSRATKNSEHRETARVVEWGGYEGSANYDKRQAIDLILHEDYLYDLPCIKKVYYCSARPKNAKKVVYLSSFNKDELASIALTEAENGVVVGTIQTSQTPPHYYVSEDLLTEEEKLSSSHIYYCTNLPEGVVITGLTKDFTVPSHFEDNGSLSNAYMPYVVLWKDDDETQALLEKTKNQAIDNYGIKSLYWKRYYERFFPTEDIEEVDLLCD